MTVAKGMRYPCRIFGVDAEMVAVDLDEDIKAVAQLGHHAEDGQVPRASFREWV